MQTAGSIQVSHRLSVYVPEPDALAAAVEQARNHDSLGGFTDAVVRLI